MRNRSTHDNSACSAFSKYEKERMNMTNMMTSKNFMTRERVTIPKRRIVVSKQVQAYLEVSRAENTIRAYVADVRSFLAWGGRIPSSPERVAEYLACEAEKLSFSTLRRRLSAISLAHRELGYPSPSQFEVVKGTLRGIRRSKPSRQNTKRAFMAEHVLAATKELTGVAGARDKALLMIGFAGAFRRSELVALNVEDFGMRDGELVVKVRSSKTDQMAVGREVVIPPGRGKRCPIKALLAWLKISGITSGAVLRRVNRNGVVLDGRLSGGVVGSVVKFHASEIGLDPTGFGGHSLRVGYVTTAALKGMPIWAIRRQTDHRSDMMLEAYVRPNGALPNIRVL